VSETYPRYWPPGLPQSLSLPEKTICDSLDASAHRFPSKPCVIYYDTVLSYAQFREESGRLAAYLQNVCSVRPGDRVLLCAQNSPQFSMAYYAIARVGAIIVPINPMSREAEFAHYIEDSGAHTLIAAQEMLPYVSRFMCEGRLEFGIIACYADWIREPTELELPKSVAAPRVTDLPRGCVPWSLAVACEQPLQKVAIHMDDLCVMPYTSGTTGYPKGCMHSHHNVMFTATAGMAWRQTKAHDVVMAVTPMFHVSGMQRCLNGPIIVGCTTVILTRWDANVAAAVIERYGITSWTGVPTMFIDLLGNPELDGYDLSSLTALGGGGAAMPAAIKLRMDERLGVPYVEGYGLTETLGPSHINPPQRPKAQCLGIPIFDTQSYIMDPDTGKRLSANEVGEIIIRGPQLFRGYWKDEAATADAFVDLDGVGYFRTGDLGYIDEDGYFFIVDRMKRMINASGFKVWPAEVEALFYEHPAVRELCVIAAPDPHRGETVKAVIVLESNCSPLPTEAELIIWARARMSAYKVPHLIEFVSDLPKSGSGKVQWRLLQEKEFSSSKARSAPTDTAPEGA